MWYGGAARSCLACIAWEFRDQVGTVRGPVAIRDVATAAVHGDFVGGDSNILEYGSPGPSAPSVHSSAH